VAGGAMAAAGRTGDLGGGRGGGGACRLPAAPAGGRPADLARRGDAAAGGAGRSAHHDRRLLPLLLGRAGAGGWHRPLRVHAGVVAPCATAGAVAVARTAALSAGLPAAG